MEKVHETYPFNEKMKDLEELQSLLGDMFGDEFIDQIDTILKAPEQFPYLTKELMDKSIQYLIIGNNGSIDTRLHLLTIERKIEQSLEILQRTNTQKDRKIIPYKNSKISSITLLTAFLIGIRDGLRKYRNEGSPENMTHILST